MKSEKYWKFILPLTLLLAVPAFVPFVTGSGTAEPYLFAMPRTLWVSMAISLCIYAVLIAAMVLSKED